MFSIKQITPQDYIKKAIENALTMEIQIIVRQLNYIALKAVNLQRELGEEYRGLSAVQLKDKRKEKHTPNYIDDTGNLRNSIGYMIAVDGVSVTEDFKNGTARQLAQSALSGENKGVTLILTAGMSYAKYVHRKGYDVLTTAELFCNKELKKLIGKYK